MKQSHLFTKTRRETPTGEEARNAQLLIRAGYIHKEMAGAYAFLPLGLRVLEKIKQIVREEMNALGAEELIMTTLQRKELWEQTNRWDDETVDCWFKSELKAGGAVGLAWSHEEPIGNMMKSYISSYKDLPIYLYQFQTKLRNELRAKSGVMRGREFVMKDMYSFCADEEQHDAIYEGSKDAYMRVFTRLGIGEDTFVTFAPGGAFTEFSHEFQTICEAGEDISFVNREKRIAINSEVLGEKALSEVGVSKEELSEVKTAEVGNIFNFGRQKADELGLVFKNAAGETLPVWMGSYGIGITRLVGVLAEKFADEGGLVWPAAVAPYSVYLIGLNPEDPEIRDWTEGIYQALKKQGVEVLYDDRDVRPGEKFADSDLIGLPQRIVIGKNSKKAGTFEVTDRASGKTQYLNEAELYQTFGGTK